MTISFKLFKRSIASLLLSFICLSFSASSQTVQSPAKGWTVTNPFEHKVFIENKGQFDGKNDLNGSLIQYGYVSNGGMDVYFTNKGLTYRYDELVSKEEDEQEEASEAKSQEEEETLETVSHFIHMNWVGANPNATIVTENPVTYYFNYANPKDESGTSSLRASAFRKIIYKNLYPNIDVEYVFPENKRGVKYSLILHPGADVSLVKMNYSGAERLNIDEHGNLQITTAFGIIVDHAPVTFYEGSEGMNLSSAFNLSGYNASFNLPSYNKSQTVVIDPWTSDPNFPTYNAGYEVEYDSLGNTYIYGGAIKKYQEIKFDNAGNPLWVYVTPWTTNPFGDFVVDKESGSSYIVEGTDLVNGGHIAKVDAGGTNLKIFKTLTKTNFVAREMWRIVLSYNCTTKEKILAVGGAWCSTISPNPPPAFNAYTIDTSLTTMNYFNICNTTEPFHDVGLMAADISGNVFMSTVESSNANTTVPQYNNVIMKGLATSLTPTSYVVPDNHTFFELKSIRYANNVYSIGYNGMAVNSQYLYTYDGALIQRWDKNTGALLKAATIGAQPFVWGGIFADECGNVYVGMMNQVQKYDINFNLIGTVATATDTLYDVMLGPGNLLYATGKGYVGVIQLTGPQCDPAVCTLNPKVVVNGTSLCAGSCYNISASASSGLPPYTYNWSPNIGTGTGPFSVCPVNTTTYTVTVTDANGLTSTDTALVIVNKATADAGPDASICIGNSTTLNPSGGVTYNWSPATDLSCTACKNPVATPSATRQYYVTVTDANNCTATDSMTVTVNPSPPIDAGMDVSICSGTSTTLTATGGTGYTWSPSTGLSCTNCQSPVANPASTTTYTVVGTDAKGCSATDYVTVTVGSNLSVFAGLDQSICIGGSTTISVNPSSGLTYTWLPSTGLSCNNCPNPVANPTTTTTYIVGASNGLCYGTDTITIKVNPLPPANAGPDASICNGKSTTLNPSGGISYQWSPATGLSCTACQNPIASPASSTQYTVTVTDGNNCSASDSMFVIVNANPPIYAGTDVSICPGTSTTLTATGGTSYSWTPSTGLSCTACQSPTANPTATTIYTVTGTDGNGCSGTSQVTVSVSSGITVNAGPDQNICIGGSATINVNPSSGFTYSWYPATGLSCSNCPNPIANPSTTTTYVVGISSGLCVGTDSVTIVVNPLPVINAGPDKSICTGSSVKLTASGGVSYSWSPSTDLSCNICPAPVASPANNSTYIVTGTDVKGCVSSDTISVNVNPLPTAVVIGDTVIEFGNSAPLFASGGTNYSWSPGLGLSCTACPDPIASPRGSMVYCVTATDQNGCSDTACVNVLVDINCGQVFVPNAFSPNDDGENELECVLGNCIVSMVFSIYDRWGEKVFETTDPKACWDGIYKGKKLNTAVFVYQLSATLITGERIEKHGNISLIR